MLELFMTVKRRVVLFLSVMCFIGGLNAKTALGQGSLSLKKGVAGVVNKQRLEALTSSWFYTWQPLPAFNDNQEKWSVDTWNSFIPLFMGKTVRSGDSSYQNRINNVTSTIQSICNRTDYCSNLSKGYYLIGNEPDVKEQDLIISSGDKVVDIAKNAVKRQGDIARIILQKDPDAKLIMMGWGDWHGKIDNVSGTTTEELIREYISQWKIQWEGDSLIANLANIVTGWHLHVYDEDDSPNNRGTDYSVCPDSDELPRRFLDIVNSEMVSKFGKIVVGQELWVTEMGTLWNVPYETQVLQREKFKDRMRCLVNVFENSPVVTRYAWFFAGCNCGEDNYCGGTCTSTSTQNPISTARYNLYYSSSNNFQITDLGRLYATLPDMPNFSLRYSGSCLGSSCDAQCGGGGRCRKTTACYGLSKCAVITNAGGPTSTPRPTATPILTPIPTSTSTSVPTGQGCISCPSGVRPKSLGNANCDNKTNILDFATWKKERITFLENPQTRNNWKSDFNCDGRVAGDDLTIWKANQQ